MQPSYSTCPYTFFRKNSTCKGIRMTLYFTTTVLLRDSFHSCISAQKIHASKLKSQRTSTDSVPQPSHSCTSIMSVYTFLKHISTCKGVKVSLYFTKSVPRNGFHLGNSAQKIHAWEPEFQTTLQFIVIRDPSHCTSLTSPYTFLKKLFLQGSKSSFIFSTHGSMLKKHMHENLNLKQPPHYVRQPSHFLHVTNWS